jgi:replicative DNA helicase
MSAEPLPTTLLEHALAYAARGLEIFPLKPDKAPLIGGGMNASSSDPDKVLAWWQQWPNALIGCRVPVDRIILDVDPRHGGDQTLQGLEDHYGKIRAGRVHLSGRGDGGAHYWFELPKGVTLSIKGLDEWAREHGTGHPILKSDGTPTGKWLSGIDLLTHTHRYTILPPSPHATTGNPYTWQSTSPAVPLPGFLLTLLTKVEAEPRPERPKLAIVPSDESPADWLSRTGNFNNILGAHAWTVVFGDGNSDGSKWRHPDATNESSASIKHGCLFVYSTGTQFDDTTPGNPNGYTRFHAYAILEHGGDMAAAARAVNEMRGRGEAQRIDPGDLIATVSDEPWPEPQPIKQPANLPAWPVHTLPDWASQHCTNTAEQLQVPVDLCAQLALGAIATTLMGHANIRCGPNWIEPVNLYLATAMHSGAGKSPAEKHIAGPLRDWERRRIAVEAPRLVQARLEKELADQRAKKARDEAMKGTTSINEAARIATEAELLPVPHSYRLTADDATPEAIFSLLHQHDERLAILSTEADILDMAAGTYGRDGKVNVSIYLKAWSGDSAQRDRKGSGNQPAETLKLARPLLTCSITIQPALLDDYRTSNPLLRSRGFFARFMWSVPTATIGGRDRTLAFTRSTDTRSAWGEHLVGLADRWSRFLNPAELHCSPEAIEAFSAWITDMEPELADGRRLEPIRDPSSKIQSSVLRTVALLHLADGHPQDEPVSAATMLRAIEIGDYWVEHSLYVEGGNESGNPAVERQAKVLLDWTRSQRRREFTPRDFYANRRTEFESALSTGPLFELLVDRGWLRCTVGCVTDIGQRGKTVRFEVHPSNFTKGAQ